MAAAPRPSGLELSARTSQARPQTVRQKAARIRLVAFDVDGTLTDGKLYFGPQGEALKAFSVLDGQGLALLKKAGLKLALITGRSSEIVSLRAAELNIDRVLQGVKDKRLALLELAKEFDLDPKEIAMMGDDWPDLAAFSVAGFKAAPSDGHVEVRARADWVAQACAGAGAARELCDYLLKAQGTYQKMLLPFIVPASVAPANATPLSITTQERAVTPNRTASKAGLRKQGRSA
jgi:3-deoxy-D-manno-octulosonate 8-phosphate phosphatase (KDO 8-P phosphatase)